MSKLARVLFITAPIGSGHIRAAQAISKAVHEQSPQADTFIANIFDFINPAIGGAILKVYLKILEYFPQAYGMAYGWGNSNKLALLGREYISRYMAGKMRNFIDKYSPSVIVCTHATPAGMVAQLIKEQQLDVPSFAAVTDFTVHRLWIYPELDYYFVANSGMQKVLSGCGVSEKKSQAVGIPVDATFASNQDRSSILRTLNLNKNQKIILIMGGGAGVFPLENIALACDEIDIELQIVVVAGKNTVMYKKLLDLKPKFRHSLTVLGFVDNIHELMTISDVLISKPGGMTSAEALCKGLPMIIYKPIPGQEAANTKYLLEHNAALAVESISQVKAVLTNLLIKSPELLRDLHHNALQIGKPNAADIIARHILDPFTHK